MTPALPVLALQLCTLDGAQTYRGLTSGRAVEGNPVASALFDTIGVLPGIVLAQAVAAVVLTCLLLGVGLDRYPVARRVAFAGAVVWLAGKAYIVWGNHQLLAGGA